MPALPAHSLESRVKFAPAAESDFEQLLAVRIAAMRESLERIGRFDPARARQRLQETFALAATWWIYLDGEPIGFYVFRRDDDGYHLDHLYIDPPCQGMGIGSLVMARLIAEANGERLPIYVGALQQSDANRFYQRHAFEKLREEQWDVYYIRGCD